jgi:hypothetical protein
MTVRRAWRTRVSRLLAAMIVVGGATIAGSLGTWAAFKAITTNAGNSVSSGTVALSDDDQGAAMLTLSNAQPGDSDTSCIVVTYNGSLASRVRLYGTTSGTGLDPYLDLKVTRGTISSPAFDSCTGFNADSTEYLGAGQGAGVIYNGSLQGYADDYATGLVDPYNTAPESWTTGEAHAYKVEITLQGNPTAAGKNATETFVWEARNQ